MRKCQNCGEALTSRHQKKFCSRSCFQIHKQASDRRRRINLWLANKISGYSNGKNANWLRNYLLEDVSFSCEKCGFSGTNPFTKKSVLQIHHIDGDKMNNKRNNLQILCPNCHSMTDNFGGARSRK